MPAPKTAPTAQRVADHLDGLADPQRRRDCLTLCDLMTDVTGSEPVMWGASIVGFGSYRYRGAGGREGDWMQTGFASRRGGLAIYGVGATDGRDALLARLGPHRMGTGCLTIKRLSDVDLSVLRSLLEDSVRRRPTERASTPGGGDA